jgi:hypothetical protein
MSANSLYLKYRKLSTSQKGGDEEEDGGSTAEQPLPGQPTVEEFSAFNSTGISFSHMSIEAKFRPLSLLLHSTLKI